MARSLVCSDENRPRGSTQERRNLSEAGRLTLLVCERMHLSEQRSASLTRSTVTAGTLLPAKFKQT